MKYKNIFTKIVQPGHVHNMKSHNLKSKPTKNPMKANVSS